MLFLEAMASYATAWLGAFGRKGRDLAPLGVRRLLVLALFPFFMLLQLFHWLCLSLDELLFPAYRDVVLRRPVFVLGVPRSGTTFLHRELARDTRFTAPRSWELVMAPAICQRRVIGLLGRIDRVLGGPMQRTLEWILWRIDGGVSEVHPIGLSEAEEDYLALLPAAGCFFTLLCFPHSGRFRHLAAFAAMPEPRRRRLLDHYHRLLQRHVYANAEAQLLSKNAAFASWAPFLAERYPDALILLCIREPTAAVTSQLRSLAGARTLFASLPVDADIAALFEGFFADWYVQLETFAARAGTEPLVVEQEWMRGHTDAVLELIRDRLLCPPASTPATTLSDDGGAGAKATRDATKAPPSHPLHADAAYRSLRQRAIRQRAPYGPVFADASP